MTDTNQASEELTRFDKLKKERRAVRVPVDINIFADMLIDGIPYGITVDGLPKDCIFFNAGQSFNEQALSFVFLHESFKKVVEGMELPVRRVVLTTTQLQSPTHKSKDVGE